MDRAAAHAHSIDRSAEGDRASSAQDCAILLAFGLVLIGSGIGLREPWPPDEPRFALIVRDMVATGEWLLPRVAGELYEDKPPLYFWLMAVVLVITQSLRAAFLLPSLASALTCVFLVYDLGRRLWNRDVARAAALALLVSVQFVWEGRQAQIDMTLCFLTTLSLYGLLRHLLLGPEWGWYAIGWAAAGLGVVTKGVGFLPLFLVLLNEWFRSPRWQPRARSERSLLWLAGPASFVAAVAVWLVPLLIAASQDPEIARYCDALLWEQTVVRYAEAWHHRQPFWYYLLAVIPWFWLPLTVLLPWLLPRWRGAWQQRDLRIALLLSWVVVVVLFFSLSSGKRGVYVLPALPAFVLAAAPYLSGLLRSLGAQRAIFGIAAGVALICSAAAYLVSRSDIRARLLGDYAGIDPLAPMLVLACLLILICALARPRRGFAAYAGVLVATFFVFSVGMVPMVNPLRSGAAFAARIEQVADREHEIGFTVVKEQYLLQMRRPIVHFGHARWRDWYQEAADAALWVSGDVTRRLVVDERALMACFSGAQAVPLGRANRRAWYLVSGKPAADCVARGNPKAERRYVPPTAGERI